MNLVSAISVIVSVVAFAISYRRLCTCSFPVRLVSFGVFAFFSAPALLFALYYLHVLPERTWFYTLRSWPGTEMLVVFVGCAGGAAASLLSRLLLGVPLFAVLVLGIAPYIKAIIGPLPDSAFQERWEGEACLQSTPSTCGPASVCTILRRLGVPSTEQEIARAAFSYVGGTEAWYLARHVRRKGLVARFDFRPTFSPDAGQPALVGVRFGSVGHFIAVLEIRDGEVTFVDPLEGEQRLSLPEFQSRYKFTGFHMVVKSA
ncbi:cysteine peptidase family C39 domain-containing protein [Verrucomicrobiota bacterium sgz303538]